MSQAYLESFLGRHAEDEEGPDITPLLDVVFILLIFFIVAAAFAVRGMDVDLPPAASSRPISGIIMELRLDEDGKLSCDGVILKPETLGVYLRSREDIDKMRGLSGQRQLVLRAAHKAPVGELVRIVDAVRALGGNKLIIATGQPGPASDKE